MGAADHAARARRDGADPERVRIRVLELEERAAPDAPEGETRRELIEGWRRRRLDHKAADPSRATAAGVVARPGTPDAQTGAPGRERVLARPDAREGT